MTRNGDETLRIGIDGRELVDGARTGIRRYVLEVLRAAASPGAEVVVYGDRTTRLDPQFPGVSLAVVDAACTPWWDQVALPRRLARDRVSVFLSPYYKGPLLAPCPVVLTIHDLFFIGYLRRRHSVRDGALTAAARLYARRAAAIVADSESSRRTVVERLGVAPAKVTVIPVGVGPEFTPQPLPDAVVARYGVVRPYVLYVGNFKPHKNLPRLLRAYAGLPAEARGAHRLLLAGADLERQPGLEALARSLGLADRVRFAGPIDDADLPALYAGAALLALPSLEEGFGLPALEAMACGTPVVAADRGAIPEVVGDAAVLVDPEDEPALGAALARVLSTPALRTELSRRGLARAQAFSPDRTAGRVLALLRQVSRTGAP